MQTLKVNALKPPADLNQAKSLADRMAVDLLGTERECLGWYDSANDRDLPLQANQDGNSDEFGYADYPINRGAELKVVINDGDYTFFYRRMTTV